MDLPAPRAVRGTVPVLPEGPPLRRRPSGEPPALPHHLKTSGIEMAGGPLVVLVVADAWLVFGPGAAGQRRGRDRRRRGGHPVAAAGRQAPAVVGVFRVLAWPSSWTALNLIGPAPAPRAARPAPLPAPAHRAGCLAAAVRRRHLARRGDAPAAAVRGGVPDRLVRLGDAVRADGAARGWAGRRSCTPWCRRAAARNRQVGGERRWWRWSLGRMHLGVDAPTDVLVGVVIGVTIPLLGFRCSPRTRRSR